ncbi:MAG: acylphosphatase [Planctomycetales bacterium]|nr:acylphosphatase [Planctomycetales bacterium]
MNGRRYLFSGNVQGVGFRYTTQRIASRFAVVGFVRNLSDGRVELVVEGNDAEIDAFASEVKLALSQNIEGVSTDRLPATGQFDSFSIRH